MKQLAQHPWMVTSVILVGAFAIGLWGGQESAFGLAVHEGVAEHTIRIEAEGDVLHYQETLVWDEPTFSEMVADEAGFSSHQIEKFTKTYQVNAQNFRVELVRDRNTTVFKCDIHGTHRGNWYDFHWFLNPLGLDFLNSPFERAERTLSWEGRIEGISTTIVLEFPFSISNCHAHVWPQ
jgi:hypothetical protein